jgi:hypothetical protein
MSFPHVENPGLSECRPSPTVTSPPSMPSPTAETASPASSLSRPTETPSWVYFDEREILSSPAAGHDFLRSEVVGVVNCLADNIGRHMEKQGFWDDEDELIATIKFACANMAVAEERQAVEDKLIHTARRWKNGEKYSLIITEIAEAVEADRKGDVPSDHLPGFTMFEEEMADVIVRVLDLCRRRKARIGEALAAKLEYNGSRPFRHGKRF